uniref:NB-ARC domain-containing protein n=1 Tax=Leersia perrieri TaxID=77586 RepID=A0A0D9XTB1_9ORYZ
MQLIAGVMSPLLNKLGDLLMAEFTLNKRTRKGIKSLQRELTMMHIPLHKVAEVPLEQLDPMVKEWARQVRELTYDMEDAVDAYMVRVEDEDKGDKPTNIKNGVKNFVKKTIRLFRKGKDLHQIIAAVDEAQDLAKQLVELRQRYGLELHDGDAAGPPIDPRLMAMYKDVKEFVGIDGRRKELIEKLLGPDEQKHLLKTVSIVGFGGLGKTTLAKAVYDKICRSHFDCGSFVSIGQNPDMKKVFKDMLYDLDMQKYKNIHSTAKDEKLLIDNVRSFLENKRYFIIIDDIWDEKIWRVIDCAFPENNHRNRVITTTRIVNVSEKCCASYHAIYTMKPLSRDDSETLFCKRIFTDGKGCPQYLSKIVEGILKKCGGLVHSDYGRVEACGLHDMVLDLICHLSREENFVSTLDDVGQSTDFETKVRRLSLQVQDCRARHTSPLATIDLSHKRCDFRKGGDLNLSHIVKLFHLRYLGLRDARIGEIPVGIEKLQLLQTLDLEDSDIEELPSAVFQLGHLMCLRVDLKTKLPKLPDGKGHLTSLQVLSGINMCRNPDFVRELRNMTMLRELFIRWDVRDDNLQEVLVESLCNLNKIQTLLIDIDIKGSLDIYHEGTMGGSSTSRQV